MKKDKPIFLSYSRKDELFAIQLASDLSKAGLTVWIDREEIRGGDEWERKIIEAIKNATSIIVCLSPDAIESHWVRREIFLAHSLQKHIVPVVVKECLSELVKYDETKRLLNLQLLDFTQIEYKLALERLLIALSNPQQTLLEHRIFARSDSAEFHMHIDSLMNDATHVILIGIGLNIIQRDTNALEFMQRASDGNYSLEIYLADPISPQIEMRLIEEELGAIKPSFGRSTLVQRLNTLVEMQKNLEHPEQVQIRLFNHYLTFALLILDEDYFIYPYGYATLGNFSPVLHFSKRIVSDQPMIIFLDGQYQKIKESATNAELAVEVRNRRFASRDKLHHFAVFFVPPEESILYRFGTQVLGYDVRQRQMIESRWSQFVGNSKLFGFHLTISDALYFLSERHVKNLWKEISFLVRDFEPFNLVNLEFQSNFPDARGIVARCDEPTGKLESLHFEMVYRIYRHAVASDYSLGLAPITRDNDSSRAEFMVRRYRAPYILHRYQPHFTLLSNTPTEEHEKRLQEFRELENEIGESIHGSSIMVDRLAFMTRPNFDTPWIIEDEITLG
jgi:hypothetical protein